MEIEVITTSEGSATDDAAVARLRTEEHGQQECEFTHWMIVVLLTRGSSWRCSFFKSDSSYIGEKWRILRHCLKITFGNDIDVDLISSGPWDISQNRGDYILYAFHRKELDKIPATIDWNVENKVVRVLLFITSQQNDGGWSQEAFQNRNKVNKVGEQQHSTGFGRSLFLDFFYWPTLSKSSS